MSTTEQFTYTQNRQGAYDLNTASNERLTSYIMRALGEET